MIVTTKNGKNLDKPVINFRFETALSTPTSRPETVDAVTYMQMYNESVLTQMCIRDRFGVPQLEFREGQQVRSADVETHFLVGIADLRVFQFQERRVAEPRCV